jgi:hypothetical protein
MLVLKKRVFVAVITGGGSKKWCFAGFFHAYKMKFVWGLLGWGHRYRYETLPGILSFSADSIHVRMRFFLVQNFEPGRRYPGKC